MFVSLPRHSLIHIIGLSLVQWCNAYAIQTNDNSALLLASSIPLPPSMSPESLRGLKGGKKGSKGGKKGSKSSKKSAGKSAAKVTGSKGSHKKGSSKMPRGKGSSKMPKGKGSTKMSKSFKTKGGKKKGYKKSIVTTSSTKVPTSKTLSPSSTPLAGQTPATGGQTRLDIGGYPTFENEHMAMAMTSYIGNEAGGNISHGSEMTVTSIALLFFTVNLFV